MGNFHFSIPLKSRTFKPPILTLQRTERIHQNGKISASNVKKNSFLKTTKPISVNSNTSELVPFTVFNSSNPDEAVAVIGPIPKFKNQTGVWVTSSIVSLKPGKDISLAVLNVFPHKIAVSRNTSVARVTVLTPKKAAHLKSFSPSDLSILFETNAFFADSQKGSPLLG